MDSLCRISFIFFFRMGILNAGIIFDAGGGHAGRIERVGDMLGNSIKGILDFMCQISPLPCCTGTVANLLT